jgi:hypothetical protein
MFNLFSYCTKPQSTKKYVQHYKLHRPINTRIKSDNYKNIIDEKKNIASVNSESNYDWYLSWLMWNNEDNHNNSSRYTGNYHNGYTGNHCVQDSHSNHDF